jgi:signal transduction histidine kinase/ActR/RegA family two-component response regulator
MTPTARERRLLILAPTPRDAELSRTMFARAGIDCDCCDDLPKLCTALDEGAAVVLLPEEAIVHEDNDCLREWLAEQPAWSDLPIIVLARPGADSRTVALAMEKLGNVTVLERPIRVATLVSTVRAAVRGRTRQYQTREHFLERERTEATLVENDRRKDEFLAILAHELRNPLAPIVNSLQLLRLTTSDPEIRRIGDMVERQVTHMVRLVDDLLEVSRITRGKIELRRETTSLAEILRTAVEASRPIIDAFNHQLVVDVPDEEDWLLEADPVRLAQVFANLLNNSAKYTDPRGRIRLRARAEQGTAVISVSDNGTGIAPDKLPLVFELFTQVAAGSRAQGGLGIGLTLVKRLVEMHGGSVTASSAGPGCGSEFVVRLPVLRCVSGGAAATIAHAAAPPLADRRILVVDDNRDAADSLTSLLRMLGADVSVAYGGVQAIKALERSLPSVVLLDIGMPDMDGLEVARWIRSQPRFEQVTLIAMTGWGQEEDRRRTSEAGFQYHLTKPADLEVLGPLLFSGTAKAAPTSH